MTVPDPMAALRARAVDLAAKLAETERALDEPGVRRQARLLHELAGGTVEPKSDSKPNPEECAS